MLDAAGAIPDLDLLLSPGDEAELMGSCYWTTPLGRTEPCLLYVVLHRRHGLWTHAYRVVRDRRPGHLMIYVVRVAAGDCRDELRAWLRARQDETMPAPPG